MMQAALLQMQRTYLRMRSPHSTTVPGKVVRANCQILVGDGRGIAMQLLLPGRVVQHSLAYSTVLYVAPDRTRVASDMMHALAWNQWSMHEARRFVIFVSQVATSYHSLHSAKKKHNSLQTCHSCRTYVVRSPLPGSMHVPWMPRLPVRYGL
jgi:hypothetical protein